MKKILYCVMALMAIGFVSCGDNDESEASASYSIKDDGIVPTLTIDGYIHPTEYDSTNFCTITFDRFPKSEKAFRQLQETYGSEPAVAAVLQLMAMETYRKDKKLGEKFFDMNNWDSDASFAKRQCSQIYGSATDSYCRPYLVASYLEGASPYNGYNPDEPFTVKVRTSFYNIYHEDLIVLNALVLYLEIYCYGADSNWRPFQVAKLNRSKYFYVTNCAGMLTQCQQIRYDSTDDYNGIWK